MKVLIVICALVALAVSGPVSYDELDANWSAYKKQYNKIYDEETETLRRMIWQQNLEKVERHNYMADLGKHTYWLGMNEYADMTGPEFVKMMNGFIPRKINSTNPVFLAPSHIKVPDTVDWRKEGYVTPVKNQQQCGSCWAFSTTGSLEGQHFKKTKQLISLSEQNLVDCSRAEGNMGCNGGLMDNGFRYIQKNKGIDTEESYPYEARDAKCRFKRDNVGATDTGFTDIPRGDENALKQAVATVGPISVAIDAGHNSFQLYKRGVYNERQCSSTRLDHGVLAVGFGTESGEDYWLVKNSWGTSWGMDGYIMMSRNKQNQCGIATQASYPLV